MFVGFEDVHLGLFNRPSCAVFLVLVLVRIIRLGHCHCQYRVSIRGVFSSSISLVD